MFAISLIIALMVGMAGLFAAVVYQIAQARRQQFAEESSLNGLASSRSTELVRAARKAEASKAAWRLARSAPKRAAKRRPHAPMLAR